MGLKDFFIYNDREIADDFTLSPAKSTINQNGVNNFIHTDITDKSTVLYKNGKISPNIKENLEFIKDAFCNDKNFDFVIREFSIPCRGNNKDGFVVTVDLSEKEEKMLQCILLLNRYFRRIIK